MKKAVAYLMPFLEAEKARERARRPRRKIVHGHGQGRRPRHRQEHRGRGARPATTTRSIDLGVMVPGGHDPDDRARDGRRHRSASRPHHAVARGDGRTWPARWSAQGFTVPLLIGGATTSRAHTAVQDRARLHAGRSSTCSTPRARWGWSSQLKSAEQRAAFDAENRREQERLRQRARRRSARRSRSCPLERGPARGAPRIDWAAYEPPQPSFTGVRVLETCRWPRLVPFIDWSPFFHTWELQGTYPRIFENPDWGAKARELFDDAQALLKRLVDGAAADGARASTASSRPTRRRRHRGLHRRVALAACSRRFHTLRQQTDKGDGRAQPGARRLRRAARDRPRRLARRLRGDRRPRHRSALVARARDASTTTTRSIMAKALADRLAEALAEWLHQQARARLGLRPRRGALDRRADPRAVPRHPARARLSGLPRPHGEAARSSTCSGREERAGIQLTESFAMLPAASVCGFYFAHPQARYFPVGGSTATRCSTTTAARAWTSRRWSAGSRRTSTTSPDA